MVDLWKAWACKLRILHLKEIQEGLPQSKRVCKKMLRLDITWHKWTKRANIEDTCNVYVTLWTLISRSYKISRHGPVARTSRYRLQRPASEKEASLQAALENAVAKLSNPVPTKVDQPGHVPPISRICLVVLVLFFFLLLLVLVLVVAVVVVLVVGGCACVFSLIRPWP